MSIMDLIAIMAEIAPGIALSEIQLSSVFVTWERPATPEELAERHVALAKQQEKTERWERATLARLIEKYGSE